MQAECVICMEHFQSSDAISASECGHVFHEACIARWLDESGILAVGHCPQCRTVVNKECLMRLFFTATDSSRTLAITQRDIDKLQARIDDLNVDCRRKEDSIVALNAECRRKEDTIDLLTYECRQQAWTIDDLTDDCRRKDRSIEELTEAGEQKDETIEELTDDCEQKDETIEELTDDCAKKDATIASITDLYWERNDSLAQQTTRVKQLTKALEKKEAFHEQQMRAKENELYERSASVQQQLESQLDTRKEEKERLERACTAYKAKLDFSRLLACHWELTSARFERIIAGHEQDKANKQRYSEMAAQKAPTKTPVPTVATMRLFLSVREQQLLDLEARLRKETEVNAAFEDKLVQFAAQIDRVDKRCMKRLELIDDGLKTATKTTTRADDSGLSNETNINNEQSGEGEWDPPVFIRSSDLY